MKSTSATTRGAALAALAAGLALTSHAAQPAQDAFADEVDTCIAAVTSKLDLRDASKVRHVVTQKDRTGIGYVFTIETSVFAGDDQKRYEAYCVASGNNAPVKFRIDEIAI